MANSLHTAHQLWVRGKLKRAEKFQRMTYLHQYQLLAMEKIAACWIVVISKALNFPSNEKISWLWEGKLSEFLRLFITVSLYSCCNGEKYQLTSFPVNNTNIVVLESALMKVNLSSPSWLSLHPHVSKVPVLHNSLWPMKREQWVHRCQFVTLSWGTIFLQH